MNDDPEQHAPPPATLVTRLLGIAAPLLLQPTGDAHAALAMSRAGGLGVIVARPRPDDALAAAIGTLRAGGPAPFAVALPPGADLALLLPWLLARAVPALLLPAPLLPAGVAPARQAGAVILGAAATLAEALLAAPAADALLLTGRDLPATLSLTRAVARARPGLPLVASDGVSDGAALAAALAAGAGAAQLDPIGTRPAEELVRHVMAECRAAAPPAAPEAAGDLARAARAVREAAALRENLRRRKAQARARADGPIRGPDRGPDRGPGGDG